MAWPMDFLEFLMTHGIRYDPRFVFEARDSRREAGCVAPTGAWRIDLPAFPRLAP
jgi:hypothetical protein